MQSREPFSARVVQQLRTNPKQTGPRLIKVWVLVVSGEVSSIGGRTEFPTKLALIRALKIHDGRLRVNPQTGIVRLADDD